MIPRSLLITALLISTPALAAGDHPYVKPLAPTIGPLISPGMDFSEWLRPIPKERLQPPDEKPVAAPPQTRIVTPGPVDDYRGPTLHIMKGVYQTNVGSDAEDPPRSGHMFILGQMSVGECVTIYNDGTRPHTIKFRGSPTTVVAAPGIGEYCRMDEADDITERPRK